MVFQFKNQKLYLISENIRMVQNINTDTKKPFKNINEAKKWANKYLCTELDFIEEKIDIENLALLNQFNFLNIENEEEATNDENSLHLRIHNYDSDEIIYSQTFKTLTDLKNFNINKIQLSKGKYYFSILNLENIYFEKDSVSFDIDFDNKE